MTYPYQAISLSKPEPYSRPDISDPDYVQHWRSHRQTVLATLSESSPIEQPVPITDTQLVKQIQQFEIKRQLTATQSQTDALLNFGLQLHHQLTSISSLHHYRFQLFSTLLKLNDLLISMHLDAVFNLEQQTILSILIKEENHQATIFNNDFSAARRSETRPLNTSKNDSLSRPITVEAVHVVGFPCMRCYMYLKACLLYNIPVDKVIIYRPSHAPFTPDKTSWHLGDITIPVDESFDELLKKFDVIESAADSINGLLPEFEALTARPILFAAKGRVSKQITQQHQLLHCHPGSLPDFRGSTTFYYSLMEQQCVACSAILLNDKLDGGEKMGEVRFNAAEVSHLPIDDILDPLIRTACLIHSLQTNGSLNSIKPDDLPDRVFYKMHPVLRALYAINVD